MSEEKQEILKEGDEIVEGVLDYSDSKDYGFLRFENFSSSENDVYVSGSQIKKLLLRRGDKIKGIARKNFEDKFRALAYIYEINGASISQALSRPRFQDLTPIHPKEKLDFSYKSSTRLIELFSPIGKGQRAMIVAPPKVGKTILLKDIAQTIEKNNPECYIMVLLIDERPEEVTDFKRSIKSEVIASTFDEPASNHIRVSEMVIDRARAMAEMGHDVVILLDSITRLARAYNLETSSSGRTLSGGLDPASLHKPKRFFGTARNIEEGGSVTIIATALVDTGSRMDDVIFEEFRGTGNMEISLSRQLAQSRIFPSINVTESSTRRDELLLDSNKLDFIWQMRKRFNDRDNQKLLEDIILLVNNTKNNDEFIEIARKNLL